MPADFSTVFSEKVEQDRAAIGTESDLSKRQSLEFAVMTNYFNHNLLISGRVLYGDEISELSEKILDKLLKDDPDLRDKLRVYTVRTNTVNAYSTNQGIIFVTMGLIARLQNEAQLAFVLAHEAAHVKHEHVLHSFENRKELASRSGGYRGLDWEERTLKAYQYSREAEYEADTEGLEYFTAAGYDSAEIYQSYDILIRGYLPIEEHKFSFDKIEGEHFHIPDFYKIDSCDAIQSYEDIDDEESTHPNNRKRKEAIRKAIKSNSLKFGKLKYAITDSANFYGIRTRARFEMVGNFLRSSNYLSALHHIQILQEDYPESDYLKRAEIMCWYGMQELSCNQQKSDYSTGYRDLEGQIQAVYYLGAKLPKKGFNLLATRFIWENSVGLNDTFITRVKRRNLDLLAQNVKRDFILETYPTVDTVKTVKRKRRKRRTDFLKPALVDLFQFDDFTAELEAAYARNKEAEDDELDDSEYEEVDDLSGDSYVSGITSYYGLSDVHKVIMLKPRFFRIDLRKPVEKQMLQSDDQQIDLLQRTKDLADRTDIELVVVNETELNEVTTEWFNKYIVLTDWMTEESNYEGLGFNSFASQQLPEVRKYFGSDYLAASAVWHFSSRKPFNFWLAVISAAYVVPFPFYLAWQLQANHYMDYSFVVFDLKSGEPAFIDSKSLPAKYRRDVINAHLYNSLNQLSRPNE